MSGIQDALNAIDDAIDALREKRAAITDANEKDTINDEILDLQAQREVINDAELGKQAQLVADATADLEDIVKAAQAGPLDATLAKLRDAASRLKTAQQALSAPGPAPTPVVPPAPTPVVPPAPTPVVPPAPQPQTGPSAAPGDFTDLLRRAMDQFGMTSRSLRAGTAAM